MNKRIRQYAGLLSAIISYYVIHEGAHFLYALYKGTFKGFKFMGLGMQVEIYSERMSEAELGVFCLVGSLFALLSAYILAALAGKICDLRSKVIRACAYYVTIALLFIDPLYLSILCGFFGGGDMNGISLLVPQIAARIIYALVFAVNIFVFIKLVLPKYTLSFKK